MMHSHKTKFTIKGLLVAAAVAIALTACEPVDEPGTAADRAVAAEESQKAEAPAVENETPVETPAAKKDKPAEPAKPEMTVSQKNAVGSAAGYLDYDAFSRKGLIHQVKFEGFSKADATFAVDYLDVDYNVQAVKSAKDYLDYDSFSRAGLIHQLVFEGYTKAQAAYGVSKTGL
jgi:colicin import membrane protein